jgi:hypothetical protein
MREAGVERLAHRRARALRVLEAGQPLLDAAQRSGEIRTDLGLEQVLDLVVAVAKIPGDRDHLAPILRAALDGLHPPA